MKKSFLKHPVTILTGAAAGVLIGLYYLPISAFLKIDSSRFLHYISFPGKLYLFFLQMVVIPLMVSAVSSGLGKLIRARKSAAVIKRMIVVFLICMAVCALTGMVLGITGRPGLSLDSGHIQLSEINVPALNETNNFFINLIPPNIFNALSLGSILAIFFFSLIMGAAIGFLHEESALLLINFFTAVFYAFLKIINWVLYLLPFGLICLLAEYAASFNLQIINSMLKFFILFGSGAAGIFILCTIIICIRSSVHNPLKAAAVLSEPIMISLAAQNSMTALPAAVNSMERELKFNTDEINLTLPFGMTLGRFGDIFYFSLCVFFTVQIYGVTLQPVHYLIIFAGVIIAGTAAAGTSGITALPLLGIILEPLKLPVEAVLIIFIAIDPIINPVRSFLIVYVNLAAAALTTERSQIPEHELLGEKQLIIYVQKTQDFPPVLKRVNGNPKGLEISFLQEIGKRCKRQIVIKDCRSMNTYEGEWIKEKADIIAGVIAKNSMPAPPKGFYFSNVWANVNIIGKKTPLYFLLSESNDDSKVINELINKLTEENYIKFISSAAKARGY